ncbi:MAG: hypothetical protein AB1793_08120 [Candidatus Thermoplasmatota archaeon]
MEPPAKRLWDSEHGYLDDLLSGDSLPAVPEAIVICYTSSCAFGAIQGSAIPSLTLVHQTLARERWLLVAPERTILSAEAICVQNRLCQLLNLGNDIWTFPLAHLYNDMHPPCNRCMEGSVVEDGAVIGSGAIILPKVHAGEDAVVAADSIVTKDVHGSMLVMGVPARVVAEVGDVRCAVDNVARPYP